MRVFLDTNVLLTGAYKRSGFAGQLPFATGQCTFVASEYARRECEALLRSTARSKRVEAAALATLNIFSQQVKVLYVPNAKASSGLRASDPNDQPILDAAVEHNCEIICTYNLKHFPGSGIRVLSPLGLLKQLDQRPDGWAIQPPVLGRRGTILVMGYLHSLGQILETADGLIAFNDATGKIALRGPQTGTYQSPHALPLGVEPIAFLFRYRESGDFDASAWPISPTPDLGATIAGPKIVLAQGRSSFREPVQALITQDGQFNGALTNLSGIPQFVPEREVPYIVRDGCLDAWIGSTGIAAAMARCDEYVAPDGGLFIGFPE